MADNDNTGQSGTLESTEFVANDVEDVTRAVLSNYLKPESFKPEVVLEDLKTFNTNISEAILKELTKAEKPIKYIAHVISVQKTGQPLESYAACQWNTNTDGYISVKAGNDFMDVIVTVYGAVA